jgi:uncharacterized coiled-coil DUF342 family protein
MRDLVDGYPEDLRGEIDRLRAAMKTDGETMLNWHMQMSKKNDEIERLRAERDELLAALTKSVELQSHYAGLLNDYDGGHRMQFSNADAWMKRLTALAKAENKK